MKDLRRPQHPAAKGLANGLVTQTNTEYRQLLTEMLKHVDGNAGVVRSSGTRRDDDSIRPQCRFDFGNRYFIVPAYLDALAQFTEILDQVVGERIVVVDNQKHCRFSTADCRFLGRHPPLAYCLLLTPYCLLPTAYCLLPPAYYSFPRHAKSSPTFLARSSRPSPPQSRRQRPCYARPLPF